MAVARYLTVTEIINRAAVESGLNSVSDPLSSTDAAIIQMVQLLNSVGEELLYVNDWSYMRREATITTTGSPNEYALPDDFDHMIDQTGWTQSNLRPLLGPVTPQT